MLLQPPYVSPYITQLELARYRPEHAKSLSSQGVTSDLCLIGFSAFYSDGRLFPTVPR